MRLTCRHRADRIRRGPRDRTQEHDAGLVAGGFAAGVFALCFVAAFLYIAA